MLFWSFLWPLVSSLLLKPGSHYKNDLKVLGVTLVVEAFSQYFFHKPQESQNINYEGVSGKPGGVINIDER